MKLLIQKNCQFILSEIIIQYQIQEHLFLDPMKQKNQKYYSENQPYEREKESSNQPIKSPSPDKKRSNIITPTKSPELTEIKRNLAQSLIEDKRLERTCLDSKIYDQSTKYYTNEDFQEYRSSQKKNQILEQLQNMMTEQFILQNPHQYRSQYYSTAKQLDYVRLLQEKQRTIRGLHEIIEMINKNNSLQLSNSSLSGTKHKKIFQDSKNSVFSYKAGSLPTEKELKNQVRILTIENQQLIHMIEKLNQQRKEQELENLQRNFQKNHLDFTTLCMKEEILSREIYEMKESLLQKDADCDALIKQNKELINQYLTVDQENQKLIRMMKDRELSDIKYQSSLIQSNISQKSKASDSQAKQKYSIIKIKEQYNQSLKVFKDSVYEQMDSFMRQTQSFIKNLQSKLNQMQNHVLTLQKFRSAYLKLKNKEIEASWERQSYLQKANDLQKIPTELIKKQKNKQIESVLMQKNKIYQRQLQTSSLKIEALKSQLIQLQIKQQQLEKKCFELREQNSQIHSKLKIQMSSSRKKTLDEIQDINQAKAREIQLQKLRSLIQKQKNQYQQQKQELLIELQALKSKNEAYEQIIQSQRQQFKEKQNDVQTRISEKEHQLKKNSSKYQSQIDHLKQLLSEKEFISAQAILSSNLESQMQSLKKSIQFKEIQIQQKSGQVIELKQKLKYIQEKEEQKKDDIKKLVQNYEKQINILKTNLMIDRSGYQSQIENLNEQLRKIILQSQNNQQLLLQSQNKQQQINHLKETIVSLQAQLNTNHKKSSQLLHQKQNLQIQRQSLKQNLEQLLNISQQVQNLQKQNNFNKKTILEQDYTLKQHAATIQTQRQALVKHQDEIFYLNQQLNQATKENQSLNKNFVQMKNQSNELQLLLKKVRSQSKEIATQKDSELAQLAQKYQSQKQEYQLTIKKLNQHLFELNAQINQLKVENQSSHQEYNSLLLIQDSNLLDQLYQLRSLLVKSVSNESSSSQKQTAYDIGKIYIQYQAKIDQNKLLYSNINELKEEAKRNLQQKTLLEKKIAFFQNNITIYQTELKQRKAFCEQLINQKTKLEKDLLLIKKLKIQCKQEQLDLNKQNLIQKVNNLVKFEEKRSSRIKKIFEKKTESPIKKINSLIYKVEQSRGSPDNRILPDNT